MELLKTWKMLPLLPRVILKKPKKWWCKFSWSITSSRIFNLPRYFLDIEIISRKNENVERVRRAHQNDLENVPFFLALGLVYICTNPTETQVKYHFLGFTGCRLLHTFSYLVLQKQPWRALAFMGGIGSCVSMAVRLLL